MLKKDQGGGVSSMDNEELVINITTTSDEYGNILDTEYTEPALIVTRDSYCNDCEDDLVVNVPKDGCCDSEDLLVDIPDEDNYDCCLEDRNGKVCKSKVIAAITRYESIMDIISGLDPDVDFEVMKDFKDKALEQAKIAQAAIDACSGILSDQEIGRLQDDLNNTIKYYKHSPIMSEAAKYSKTYDCKTGKCRYNYLDRSLELIDNDGNVIDSVGLSQADWKENPQYWIDMYSDDIGSTLDTYSDEINDIAKNIDNNLVQKYAGKAFKDKSTGKIYTCDGINVDGELVVTGGDSVKFFNPDDVELVESKKFRERMYNRIIKELSCRDYDSYEDYYDCVCDLTSDEMFDEALRNSLISEVSKIAAKASNRDKKMSSIRKLTDELKKCNLSDNAIAAIYRLMYGYNGDWSNIYSALFKNDDSYTAAHMEFEKNGKIVESTLYSQLKLQKQYKGFRIYKAYDDDMNEVYICYPKGYSTRLDDPEWEAGSMQEMIDWIDSYEDDLDYYESMIKTESIVVSNNDWTLTTGRSQPRGMGTWTFKAYPGGETKTFKMASYGQAKRDAMKWAKEKGYTHIDLQG